MADEQGRSFQFNVSTRHSNGYPREEQYEIHINKFFELKQVKTSEF